MNIQMIAVFLFLSISSAYAAADSLVVMPDVVTVVELSNAEPNRIVCRDVLDNAVASIRHGLVVEYRGSDAYVKFPLVEGKDGKLVYASEPAELFIPCGDSTYHIVAVPKTISAKTIMLSGAASGRSRKNAELFSGVPDEDKLIKIIQAIYTGAIPDSFTVKHMNVQFDLFKEVLLTRTLSADVDGEGLAAAEYTIALKKDVPELDLIERNFLVTELVTRPGAISIDPLHIKQGETARMIVVERKEREGR